MDNDLSYENVKVLVVNDNIDTCRTFQEVLQRNQFTADFTTDTAMTLPLLRNEGFRLVVLSLTPPREQRLRLLKEIHAYDPKITVIVTTGEATGEHTTEAIPDGVFETLRAPLTTETLVATVKRAAQELRQKGDLNKRAATRIALIIKRRRKEQALSLRQLASRSGISPSLIHQIEHAQTAPSLSTLSKLSTALETPLEEFFKGL
jgi:DNA-binding NtrC family response regulator